MRSLLVAAALVLPLAAAAQTSSIELKIQGADSVTLGPDKCGVQLPISWTLPGGTQVCSDFTVWLTTADCGDKPGTSDTTVHTVASGDLQPTGSFSLPMNDLPLFNGADAVPCGTLDQDITYKVCGAYKIMSGTFTGCDQSTTYVKETSPPKITYDSKAPGKPTITQVSPLDGALSVGVSTDSDTETVHVEARAGSVVVGSQDKSAPAGSVRVGGLTNGTTYDVYAVAFDAAGNRSAESDPMQGTPTKTVGIGQAYRDAGGKQQAGCSAAGVGSGGFAALLLGALFISRRRSWR